MNNLYESYLPVGWLTADWIGFATTFSTEAHVISLEKKGICRYLSQREKFQSRLAMALAKLYVQSFYKRGRKRGPATQGRFPLAHPICII